MAKKVYDTVVIGGGIYGASCAYFLKNKDNSVLLIEKNKIGSSGATSYSRGITRVYDPVPSLSRLSYTSLQYFLNWDKHNLPGKSPYSSSGFVYLMDKKHAEKAASFSQEMGNSDYPITVLESKAIAQKYPWIKNTVNKIAIYEHLGGYGNPTQTAINFANGFKEKKGEVYENCCVQAIKQISDQLWDIVLPHDTVQCKSIVLTVGAYTKKILPTLPIFTRSISLTQLVDHTKAINISLIDETIETYIRPNAGGSFYAGSQVFEIQDTPDLLNESNSNEVVDAMTRLNDLIQKKTAHQAFNAMKGYDSYTEEKAPIVQFIKNQPGLYVAAGFSGRGYKCCIAIAKEISTQVHAYLNSQTVENKLKWRYKL
ncbi:NAD(P)/FAD-dependent oxidoreductase [Kordia jejudonensis]|uniref:NAD(P)/FAD-dependent oxidoreductase n=1 Tax=Kordia jejudonensis TaxID=1348245 RepID=UPI0006291105|nr:FAD-dependent oxidoreductase [Kordia jejudonensis]